MNPSKHFKEIVNHSLDSSFNNSVKGFKFSDKTKGFLEHSILGIVNFLLTVVSDDEYAARKGLLQDRDPRLKFLSIMLFIVCILISKSALVLSAFYSGCLISAVLSSISLLFFLKRTLFFVPLFSFFIVVPAIFSFITPGQTVVSFKLFSIDFTVTRQGIDSAFIFFFRVLASVSWAILLMLTTRQHVLLKVLRIAKVPQFFVMTMNMSYRYIFLLLDTIQKTFIAIKSRVGFVVSGKTGRRIAGATMSGLWLRSYRLQSQVYDAMLSRGYAGEPQVMEDFRICPADVIFLTIAVCTFTGTLWMNRFFH
jgi:cobalt/nickel transport system permease protein